MRCGSCLCIRVDAMELTVRAELHVFNGVSAFAIYSVNECRFIAGVMRTSFRVI